MARKWKKDEINEYIQSKQISQENYVAPTVQTNYQPSVANTVQAFNSVQPTIQPKDINKSFSFSIDNKKEKTTKEEPNLLDKGLFVGKSGVAGLTSGLTGIVDAPLQNIQEGAEKSKNKSKLRNYIEGTIKTLDTYGITDIPDTIRESAQILQDPNKKGWEKALNVGTKLLNNNQIVRTLEAAGQQMNITNKNADKTIKNIREKVETPSNKLNEKVASESESMSKGWKIAGEVNQVIGNMLPSMALSAVTKNPDIGLAAMGVSAKGQSTKEAEERGADLSTANDIGLAKGLTEVATEKLTGGLKFFGKGTADDLVEKGINKAIKNKTANFIVKQSVGIAGEIGEETISDLVGTAIDRATVDPNAKYTFDDWKKTALMTMLSTGALNTISGGYSKKAYQLNAEELEQIAQNKKVQDTVNERVSQLTTPDMTSQDIETLREQTTAVVLGEIQQNLDDAIASGIEEAKTLPNIPLNIQNQGVLQQNNQQTQEEQTLENTHLNEVNQELEETRQNDIEDSIKAFNLEENLEDTLDDDLNTNATYYNELDSEESTVIKSLENYISENNIENLTKEDIKKYIQEELEKQNNLSQEDKLQLESRYNDIIQKYLDKESTPKVKPQETKTQPSNTQVISNNQPSNSINNSIREEVTNQQLKQENKHEILEKNVEKQLLTQRERSELDGLRALEKKGLAEASDLTRLRELEDNNKYNFTGNSNLSFSKQVDNWKKGKINQNEHITIFKETPRIYQDLGLKNHPMTLSSNKLDRIYNQSGKQARKYHGLGEMVKQLPKALENPLNIVESKDGTIVAITDLTDKNGNIVIASIKIDGDGQIEIDNVSKNIPANVLTSSYGRENYDYQLKPHNGDYTGWMEEKKQDDKILYDIDEGIKKQRINGQWLSLPNSKNSFVKSNISQNNNNVKFDISNNSNMQKNEKNTINEDKKDEVVMMSSKDITKTLNDSSKGIVPDGKKMRRWIETSNVATGNENTINQADIDKITYEVQSNKKTYEQAVANTKNMNYEQKLFNAENKLNSNKKITLTDMVEAQLALREAATKGDINSYLNLQQDIAIMGTELGQIIQSMSVIQKLSPDGQLLMLQKIVNRQQKLGNKAWNGVEFDEKLVQKVLDSYDDNTHTTFNKEKLDQAVDELKQNLADQMKVTTAEKINEWRYLSMLGNPKTHIRNIVANTAMTVTKRVKETLNAGLQDLIIKNPSKKTATLKKASQEVKDLSKIAYNETFEVNKGNKYNEKNEIENKRKVFNNKIIENFRKLNASALDLEDQAFKKIEFKRAFSNFLTAQNIRTTQDINTHPEIIEQAKAFALEESKIATFQQDNEFANWINKLDKKGPIAKVVRGAVIPFTRTPLNIAKTGLEYAPGTGLLTTIADIKKAPSNMKGNVTINGISKQITGSSLALVGYALAKSGILKSTEDDDKEGKFKKDQGLSMDFSIKIGDKFYDLSWLSPSSMPLFVGASMFEQLEKTDGIDGNVIMESIANTLDPLSEMSCISSFTDILQSYQQGSSKMISQMGQKTAQNYISQFVPTISSQFARLFDTKKRTTNADKSSGFTWGQETQRQLMYKIPGLRNLLPEQTDYFGETKKEEQNVLVRGLEAFLSPANSKKDISSKEAKELIRVYDKTGENDVLPSSLNKYLKYKDEKLNMTANEWNKYKKDFGTTLKSSLKEVMESEDYKYTDDNEKANIISGLMKYSRDKAKDNYLESKGKDYSYYSDSIDAKRQDDFTIAEYYLTKNEEAKIFDGSVDTVRNRIDTANDIGISVVDYYNIKSIVNEFKADTNSDGKTISGSKKTKVVNYINSLPNLNEDQKNKFLSSMYKKW